MRIIYSTVDANIGLDRIIALVSRNTASASESILVGLKPYMTIQVIGEQTHGKYCTGWMLEATDWYGDIEKNLKEKKKSFSKEYPEYAKWRTYAKNWGIYVMISRFADRDGYNPCMPDGMNPDISMMDEPREPYELGDDREVLLRAALKEAGISNLTPLPQKARSVDMVGEHWSKQPFTKLLDGRRILMNAHTTCLSSRSALSVSVPE